MVQSADSRTVTLLVIDDQVENLELINDVLRQDGLRILSTPHPEKGLSLFAQERPDIILVDLQMPNMTGIELLEKVVERDPATEVILMTGHYSAESAVEAIQKGAADYLTKPVNIATLRQRVANSLKEAQRRKRALALDHELVDCFQLEEIVGRSPMMLDVFATIRRVAPHFRTALLTGATGTGKERVASALHRLSPGGKKRLAVCNCSALSETLYESELFGYVRGAFTGANQDKVGLFEYADGGTVFLDEIGDLPLAGQAKLLRVLQNQEIQRVGSPAVKRVDVRVIAATNRDLRQLVAEKQFREDLFYRLSVIELKLPRLAQRKEDIPLLERHFIEKYAGQYQKNVQGLTRRAQQLLARYPWPGNVRELENVIANACMMTESNVIDVADLPTYVRTPSATTVADDEGMLSLDELQRRHATRVLQHFEGNKLRAAEVLGISRTTLYNILGKTDDPGTESV